MNKIEELEERCRQLESRVEALEKALVAALARAEKATVIQIPQMLEFRTTMEPWNWTGLNGF